MPPTILVAENAAFFFFLRMFMSAIYFVGSYLWVLPFVTEHMPIKRSYFARQRQRLAYFTLYFGLNIGLCMIWAHETACVTPIGGMYYGVKRPVKIANLNIKAVNCAVLSAGICASGLPFLGTAKVRNLLDKYLNLNNSIWP